MLWAATTDQFPLRFMTTRVMMPCHGSRAEPSGFAKAAHLPSRMDNGYVRAQEPHRGFQCLALAVLEDPPMCLRHPLPKFRPALEPSSRHVNEIDVLIE